jgi:hypothetical protein
MARRRLNERGQIGLGRDRRWSADDNRWIVEGNITYQKPSGRCLRNFPVDSLCGSFNADFRLQAIAARYSESTSNACSATQRARLPDIAASQHGRRAMIRLPAFWPTDRTPRRGFE